MDDGVELKQLTVGVDRVGLGAGAGLASAIVLVAINAASVVIVFVIYFLAMFWLFGCDCWTAAVAIQEKFALGGWGLFLTFLSENCRGKFLKEVCIALLAGLLKG